MLTGAGRGERASPSDATAGAQPHRRGHSISLIVNLGMSAAVQR